MVQEFFWILRHLVELAIATNYWIHPFVEGLHCPLHSTCFVGTFNLMPSVSLHLQSIASSKDLTVYINFSNESPETINLVTLDLIIYNRLIMPLDVKATIMIMIMMELTGEGRVCIPSRSYR